MPDKEIIKLLEEVIKRLEDVQLIRDVDARKNVNSFLQGMLTVVIGMLKDRNKLK